MRVAIADGDEEFLEISQRYLALRGHDVMIASNGLESLELLRRFVPEVFVLQEELLWGGSDGVRSLMHQNPQWSMISIILTSNAAEPMLSKTWESPPVLAHFQKPFKLGELIPHLQSNLMRDESRRVGVVDMGANQ